MTKEREIKIPAIRSSPEVLESIERAVKTVKKEKEALKSKNLEGLRFDDGKPDVLSFLQKVFTETEIGREFIQELKKFKQSEISKQTPQQFDKLGGKFTFIAHNLGRNDDYLTDMMSALIDVNRQSIFGAEVKGYGKGNWKKGMVWSKIVNPILRHLLSFWFLGSDRDIESGGLETTGAAWGALALQTYQREDLGADDRPRLGA